MGGRSDTCRVRLSSDISSPAFREAQSLRPAEVSHLASKHVEDTSPSCQSRLESSGTVAASPAAQKTPLGAIDSLPISFAARRSRHRESPASTSKRCCRANRLKAPDSLLEVHRQWPWASSSLASLKTQGSCGSSAVIACYSHERSPVPMRR